MYFLNENTKFYKKQIHKFSHKVTSSRAEPQQGPLKLSLNPEQQAWVWVWASLNPERQRRQQVVREEE